MELNNQINLTSLSLLGALFDEDCANTFRQCSNLTKLRFLDLDNCKFARESLTLMFLPSAGNLARSQKLRAESPLASLEELKLSNITNVGYRIWSRLLGDLLFIYPKILKIHLHLNFNNLSEEEFTKMASELSEINQKIGTKFLGTKMFQQQDPTVLNLNTLRTDFEISQQFKDKIFSPEIVKIISNDSLSSSVLEAFSSLDLDLVQELLLMINRQQPVTPPVLS